MIIADRDGNDYVCQRRKLQEHWLNDRVMTKQIEVFSVQPFHMHTFVHSYTHSID